MAETLKSVRCFTCKTNQLPIMASHVLLLLQILLQALFKNWPLSHHAINRKQSFSIKIFNALSTQRDDSFSFFLGPCGSVENGIVSRVAGLGTVPSGLTISEQADE